MTLQKLQTLFPSLTPHAVTGHIPLEWVNENQEAFKEAMKGQGLRKVYRGPRLVKENYYNTRKAFESSTRIENAHSVVLYKISKTWEEFQAEKETFTRKVA